MCAELRTAHVSSLQKSHRGGGVGKKKKRKKETSKALATMNLLGDSLGDADAFDALAMKNKTIKTSKQRENLLYV